MRTIADWRSAGYASVRIFQSQQVRPSSHTASETWAAKSAEWRDWTNVSQSKGERWSCHAFR